MFTTFQTNLSVDDCNKWFLQKKIAQFFNKPIYNTLKTVIKKFCETFTTLFVVTSQSSLKN